MPKINSNQFIETVTRVADSRTHPDKKLGHRYFSLKSGSPLETLKKSEACSFKKILQLAEEVEKSLDSYQKIQLKNALKIISEQVRQKKPAWYLRIPIISCIYNAIKKSCLDRSAKLQHALAVKTDFATVHQQEAIHPDNFSLELLAQLNPGEFRYWEKDNHVYFVQKRRWLMDSSVPVEEVKRDDFDTFLASRTTWSGARKLFKDNIQEVMDADRIPNDGDFKFIWPKDQPKPISVMVCIKNGDAAHYVHVFFGDRVQDDLQPIDLKEIIDTIREKSLTTFFVTWFPFRDEPIKNWETEATRTEKDSKFAIYSKNSSHFFQINSGNGIITKKIEKPFLMTLKEIIPLFRQ